MGRSSGSSGGGKLNQAACETHSPHLDSTQIQLDDQIFYCILLYYVDEQCSLNIPIGSTYLYRNLMLNAA